MNPSATRSALVGLLLAGLVACQSDDQPQAPTDQRPSESNSDNTPAPVLPPAVVERRYEGPPVKASVIMLKTHPGQYLANVETTTPTGGWTLALDKGEVVEGMAKVYLTLERPAASEMVTQALVTLREQFKSTTPFEKAEIYVHLAQRGVETLTTDYRLAATSK